MGGAPVTVNFRGAYVDPTTGDALAELAAISGSIYVEPIPGFGSYRNNTASGGTDTGGGHCDLNLEGRTDADARTLETLARSIGFVAYFRPRYSPYTGNSYGWQRHLHLIRRDCADLSSKAKWQVGEYDAGRDGLAVPHKDTGSRKYVGVTWTSYLKSKNVPEEDPLAGITLQQIIDGVWNTTKWETPEGTTAPASSFLRAANAKAGRAESYAKQALARVAALEAVVKAIQADPDITAEQITAAAKAGAEAALDERISEAEVSINVTPPA